MINRGFSSSSVRRKPLPVYGASQQRGLVEESSERYDSRDTLILHDFTNTARTFNYASKHFKIETEVSQITVTEREDYTTSNRFVAADTPSRKQSRHQISWIRPRTLVAFCALLLLILAALIFVTLTSNARNGFTIPEQLRSQSYLWRYGPTAVLTVVIALWRQVDLYTRSNQPWLEMSGAAAPAHKSLLLDYKSPLLPVAFWESLRNKHWRVTTAMTILAGLKVIVAFSTGLFLIHDMPSSANNIPITLQNPAAANQNLSSAGGYYANEVYGNIAHGLALPLGVTNNATFQPIATSNKFPSNAVITTEISAAFPSMECEEASIIVNFTTSVGVTDGHSGPIYHNLTSMNTYFSSKSCHGKADVSVACDGTSSSACKASTYYSSAGEAMDCYSFEGSPNHKGQANAFVFVLLAMSPTTKPGGLAVNWSSAAVCQPKYAIERADLVQKSQYVGSNEGVWLSAPKTATNDLLPNYSPSNLTFDLNQCFKGVYNTPMVAKDSSPSANYDRIDQFFDFMLNDLGTADLEQFRNVSWMIASATHTYQRFASHLLASRFNVSNNSTSNGSYTFTEPKLFIQISNVWVVGALLGVAALSVLGLAIAGLKSSTIQQPNSLSQLSSCIRPKSVIAKALKGVGHVSDETLWRHLHGFEFNTTPVTRTRNCLRAIPLDNTSDLKIREHDRYQAERAEHWVPMSARWWFVVLCVLVPLIEIVALEIFQRQSDARDGFAEVSLSLYVSQTMATVFPAIAMLSTTTLCSAAEWAIAVFAPFSIARKKPVLLKQLDRNSAEGLAPIAIFKAMFKGQFAVSVIIISTLLGNFLTIVASGLFSLSTVSTRFDVTVSTTTQFNTSFRQSANDKVANLVSLIELHNASYPAGTYDNLAFPQVQIEQLNDNVRDAVNTANFVDIDVPVLRGRLNCSVVPKNDMSYGIRVAHTTYYNTTENFAELIVTTDLPARCQRSSGNYQNSSKMTMTFEIEAPDFRNGGIQMALVDIISGIGPNNTTPMYSGWPDYCPSIGFFVGTFDNNTSVEDKTVLVCTQLQEEVPATLRFNLPQFTLDSRTVPQLNQSGAKTVSGYQYNFTTLFNSGFEIYNMPSTSYPRSTDNFYQAMINWENITTSSMIGTNNEALLYNRTDALYGKFMAQYFGAAARVSDPNTTTINWTWPTLPLRAQLHGSLEDDQRMRVFQNNGPKIALQALLGGMIVCVVVAFTMVDIKETLPHNPVPVAGMLSLLGGSHFAEECANIAELCDDDEEPGRRLQDREVKLGWWKGKDGGPARFGLEFVDSNEHEEPGHSTSYIS